MRKLAKCLMAFLLFLSPQLLTAQIVIESTDMPTAGQTYYYGTDTMPTGFSVGPAGANVNWDFSSLAMHNRDTTWVVDPANTPYASDFTGSDLGITQNNSEYLFFDNTPTALVATGLAGDPFASGINLSVGFNPNFDQYQFSTEYGDAYAQSYGFVKEIPASQLPPSITNQVPSGVTLNKVRVTFDQTFQDTIDAYGMLTTPVGTYNSLRKKRNEQTHLKIEANVSILFVPSWQDILDTSFTAETHTWLAKETKLPVVQLTYDNNVPKTVSYSLAPPAPIADFSKSVTQGLVYYTDESLNSPATWAWDFGDGNTSNMQHPLHLYAAIGTYNTCLTVTNVAGSDTYCENVQIDSIAPNNPPVALNDTASTTAPSPVSVSVLANDQEPDGDPITLTSYSQGANGTVSQNGNDLIYTPGPSFSGIDSFTYVICDDGVPAPVLCDTATVYIDVVADPVSADLADLGSDNCNEFKGVSTSTNFSGLVAWSFSDGGTALGDTATHQFAESGTYEVCVSIISGGITYSKCDSVTVTCDTINSGIANINNIDLSVYPNPASSVVVIRATEEASKVRLYNAVGALVMQRTLSGGQVSLHVADLAKGLYFVRLEDNNGVLGKGRKLLIAR